MYLTDIDLEHRQFSWRQERFTAAQDGLYAIYNCAALCAVAHVFSLDPAQVRSVLDHAVQPWGRNEHFDFEGKTCILNLVKNPTGANEVMKVIESHPEPKAVLIVLNDHDQDGTDVSWIYDTHFEKILSGDTRALLCSGTRAYDMALRLRYEGHTGAITVVEDLQEAIDQLLSIPDCTLFAIATYTALLPTRNAICRRVR